MQNSKIQDVTRYLDSIAPPAYQESYDNAGLLTGNPESLITGILLTLDCTEAVVEEAIALKCNLVIAHHPILFKGLKRLTGSNYVERTIIKAVQNDIAIFSAHTNLDNVIHGVNKKIADKIGLRNTSILKPSQDSLTKLVTFIPPDHLQTVLKALYDAGAGQIGPYKDCSFQVLGTGTFLPDEGTKPFTGAPGKAEQVNETRVEVILPVHRESAVLTALRQHHPYEEVAYYLSRLVNDNQEVGSGMIGDLDSPEEPMAFLIRLKKEMNATVVRHTAPSGKMIQRVAVCGGAGSFLLSQAKLRGADAFVSADFKYHEFFDAEGKLIIADIGHYESEQFTKELFFEVLSKRFSTFAINFSKTVTNPIRYL